MGAKNLNYISGQIVDAAMCVHSALGPGLLVENAVVVELKVVRRLHPAHEAKLLSYLKLSNRRLGLLLNFNVVHMRDGIKRMVNNL